MNLIALTSLLLVAVRADGQLVLVDAGQRNCSIVIPDDAGQTVTRAAGELAAYIERISGARAEVSLSGSPGLGWMHFYLNPSRSLQ